MTESEYTATVPGTPIVLSINKVGGGTVGKSYDGYWEYEVTVGNGDTFAGDDLHAGTPKTHQETAQFLTKFLSYYGSEETPSDMSVNMAHILDKYDDELSLFGDMEEEQEQ